MLGDLQALTCPNCSVEMERVFSLFLADTDKPITLEHADIKPVTFQNKRELRRFMNERGWESGALL